MLANNAPRRRGGYTLVEMLLTIAILTVVLGLMVSLARYVRDRSSQQLTHELLAELDRTLDQYRKGNGGMSPPVPPLTLETQVGDKVSHAEEPLLLESGRRNNEQLVRCLQSDFRVGQKSGGNSGKEPFADQPASVYDHLTLRDAWGSPIVLMTAQHPLIGMAPSAAGRDQPFFFSAGPDRQYLTRDDNVYSYER